MKEFYSKIVGTTFCNGQEIIRNLKKDDELLLVQEPTNKYDNHAIMVCTKDKMQIGYLPRQTAFSVFDDISNGITYTAKVSEITGGTEDKTSFGCNIFLSTN